MSIQDEDIAMLNFQNPHMRDAIHQIGAMFAAVASEPTFPVKAVFGAMSIIATAVSLPLGVCVFAAFIYVHLILRIHPAQHITSQYSSGSVSSGSISSGSISSPVDGVIHAVNYHHDRVWIVISPHFLDSHILYMPLSAAIDQVISTAGRFDAVDVKADPVMIPEQNRRTIFCFETEQNIQIEMHITGHPLCRFITTFTEEGKVLPVRTPIAIGLFKPLICLDVPANFQILVQKGQRCVAGDSLLAHHG